MTAEIDYNKLSAGVGGWVSMTLMSARYDDLKRRGRKPAPAGGALRKAGGRNLEKR